MVRVMRYHPWRHLRDDHPHIHVTYPTGETGCLGRWTAEGIRINGLSTQRERRCTLTHEIVHVERGPVSSDLRLAMREEEIVERITAQRLIELDRLVDIGVTNVTIGTTANIGISFVDGPGGYTSHHRSSQTTAYSVQGSYGLAS